jgi:hypothetical protein
VRKTTTTQAIVRRHAAAYAALGKAETAFNSVTVPATFVMVPEFGAAHIFDLGQLEYQAEKYEAAHGLKAGTEACTGFRERITNYRKALSCLLLLKEEWRKQSGLNALEAAREAAYQAEKAAWSLLIDRLKSGRDVAPITRYLATDGNVLETWKLRKALKAVAPQARRR